MKLDLNINNLSGVGPKMAEKLKRLGIQTVRDLLFYFPRDWQDFSKSQPIVSLRIDEEIIIKATILNIRQTRTFRKRMSIVEAELTDETGKIRAVWFNQAFLAKVLKPGEEWIFFGKVGYDFKNRQKTLSINQYEKEPVILSIYPETEGLTSKYLRRLMAPLLPQTKDLIEDYLPGEIIENENLIDLAAAVRMIHLPKNSLEISKAKKRLGFDELLLIALVVAKGRAELACHTSFSMKIDEEKLKDFVSKLSFKLTNAQRKTAWEIIQDLNRPVPMNRLLEGDVGSGKTIVAALAAYVAALNNFQTVWLAPTEILANQHFENISKLFANLNLKVGLMTAANKKADLKTDDIIIGTHALIQKDIQIPNLGLVIIDEQHRFGVKQRAHLRKSGEKIPHLLSMTATPIPRTLALSVYGDLDISIIDELPPGRQIVKTYVVDPQKRAQAYEFIRKEVTKGRQVFVVCPLIDESKAKSNKLFDLDKKSVIGEFEKLSKKIFPELKIGILHGRMKAEEKEKTMLDFSSGKLNILVSTAVIEVGIDIPNATIMMIEGADRFGLAQLHQFRGRVGRGEHQSYCFLLSENWSDQTKKRLEAMTTRESGFELAEIDLQLRGPGELVGIRQSGLPDLKMASLQDIMLVKRARAAAENLVKAGLGQFPNLEKKLSDFETVTHLE